MASGEHRKMVPLVGSSRLADVVGCAWNRKLAKHGSEEVALADLAGGLNRKLAKHGSELARMASGKHRELVLLHRMC